MKTAWNATNGYAYKPARQRRDELFVASAICTGFAALRVHGLCVEATTDYRIAWR